MKYTLTLRKQYLVANNTPILVFDKPADFSFEAGQFVILKLKTVTLTDDRGDARSLSIASAPSDDYLEFSWRMSDSAFKQSSKELVAGDTVSMQGPFGQFILPKDTTESIVFLVGGIGITPVRSMVNEEIAQKSNRLMTVIYSNRTPEDAPFFDEVNKWSKQNNISIIHTITDAQYTPWNGNRGYITRNMIEKNVNNWQDAQYYIIGTGGFVAAMRDLLSKMVLLDQIHIDNFG